MQKNPTQWLNNSEQEEFLLYRYAELFFKASEVQKQILKDMLGVEEA